MVDAPTPSESPAQLVDPAPPQRRVVFVVGSGRSGTSTMAGALQTLGMTVPAPEVAADDTNPKGFAESQWVVDLHDELLERTNVSMADARPSAWFDTGRLNNFEPLRTRLHDLARGAAGRRRARAGRQGPAAGVVPGPVALRGDAQPRPRSAT